MSGAAYELVAAQVEGRFAVLQEVRTVNVQGAQLLANNPDRVSVLIINKGTRAVTIGFRPEISDTNGIPLGAQGGSLSYDVRSDYLLPVFAVYAKAPENGQSLLTIEIVRETV